MNLNPGNKLRFTLKTQQAGGLRVETARNAIVGSSGVAFPVFVSINGQELNGLEALRTSSPGTWNKDLFDCNLVDGSNLVVKKNNSNVAIKFDYFGFDLTVNVSTTTSTSLQLGSGPANGTYKIINKHSQKAQQSDSYAGAGLYNGTYSDLGSQKWTITKVGACYRLVNQETGLVLRAGQYDNVKTKVASGGNDELFWLSSAGGDYYFLSPKLYSQRFKFAFLAP